MSNIFVRDVPSFHILMYVSTNILFVVIIDSVFFQQELVSTSTYVLVKRYMSGDQTLSVFGWLISKI